MDDIQAIPVITTMFSLTALVLLFAVIRVSGNLVTVVKSTIGERQHIGPDGHGKEITSPNLEQVSKRSSEHSRLEPRMRESSRTASVVDSLNVSVMRESGARDLALASGGSNITNETSPALRSNPMRQAKQRRVLGRRHASLKKRDSRT